MGLTDRQKLTIDHLEEYQNITLNEDIIAYCLERISVAGNKRRHSKEYYFQIIQHYLDLNKKKPRLQQLIDESKK